MTLQLESARSGLHKIVLDLVSRAPQSEAAVLAWPMVAGANVSAKTRVLGCAEGVLEVEVPDAAWRKELIALASNYLGLLNQMMRVRIERIEFTVAGPKQARSRRAGAGK